MFFAKYNNNNNHWKHKLPFYYKMTPFVFLLSGILFLKYNKFVSKKIPQFNWYFLSLILFVCCLVSYKNDIQYFGTNKLWTNIDRFFAVLSCFLMIAIIICMITNNTKCSQKSIIFYIVTFLASLYVKMKATSNYNNNNFKLFLLNNTLWHLIHPVLGTLNLIFLN